MSATFRILLIALAVLSGTAGLRAQEPAIADDVEACRADPRFLVGGAAMGECLLEIAADTEEQLAVKLSQTAKLYCTDSDRQALRASHEQWLAARQRQCGLLTDSPGNTSSYVNGAACSLIAVRQQLEVLELLENYARPRCDGPALTIAASRFGEQSCETVEIPYADMFWQVTGETGDRHLVIRRTADGTELARQDISDCRFCGDSREDNCQEDGVFVLQDWRTPEKPALFHVCHVGAHSQRLDLIDPTVTGGASQLRVTAPYILTWKLRNGTLTATPDGDNRQRKFWPTP